MSAQPRPQQEPMLTPRPLLPPPSSLLYPCARLRAPPRPGNLDWVVKHARTLPLERGGGKRAGVHHGNCDVGAVQDGPRQERGQDVQVLLPRWTGWPHARPVLRLRVRKGWRLVVRKALCVTCVLCVDTLLYVVEKTASWRGLNDIRRPCC